ncbi:hypothetical protein O9993_21255 [Vibrio lentus]|nr:hypothetical protein [Vibrio lentus]
MSCHPHVCVVRRHCYAALHALGISMSPPYCKPNEGSPPIFRITCSLTLNFRWRYILSPDFGFSPTQAISSTSPLSADHRYQPQKQRQEKCKSTLELSTTTIHQQWIALPLLESIQELNHVDFIVFALLGARSCFRICSIEGAGSSIRI